MTLAVLCNFFDTLHNSIGHCVTISMANMAEKIIAVHFFCSSIWQSFTYGKSVGSPDNSYSVYWGEGDVVSFLEFRPVSSANSGIIIPA